jgi:hypothetical protein
MTLQNNGRRREPARAILAGQPPSDQVAGPPGTIYGSADHGPGASLCVVRKFLSALGYSWSAWPLTLGAILLLILGAAGSAPASTAMVGAGSALAGAAAARFVDLDRERRTEAKRAKEGRKRDLDETRRLAYMALMSKGTRNYELAATIANALVHHQRAAEVGEALTYLTALADGGPGDIDASEEWLNEQIWGITSELGDYSIPDGQ